MIVENFALGILILGLVWIAFTQLIPYICVMTKNIKIDKDIIKANKREEKLGRNIFNIWIYLGGAVIIFWILIVFGIV